MEAIIALIGDINGIVWGPAMLALLAGTGLYLTLGLKLTPQRKLFYGFSMLWRGRKSSGFLTAVQRSAWLNKGFHVDNKYDTESSYKFLEKRATGGDSIFRNEVQRFRTTFTISPGPAAHVPNNHTLARMLIERKRDARMSSSSREDLFRPPRVRTVVRV